MDNQTISYLLRAQANRLEREEGSLLRVRAYRQAADAIDALTTPLAILYAELGIGGLAKLPTIGDHLAYTLEGLLTTGEWRTMRPEEAHREPNRQLSSLPGIGPKLALRLREHLGVDSLDDLERAASEGRLAAVVIGPRRLQRLREALAQRHRPGSPLPGEPPVADLLHIDAEFRRVAGGQFLLAGECAGFHWRAHFAQSALAHRLEQTRDWVEVRFDDGRQAGERIVLTEQHGDLAGRRVVRGREDECRTLYGLLPHEKVAG
jgi:hypothetical protein